MNEFEDFDFDFPIDDGRDIHSFLEPPRTNQYIEMLVSMDTYKKYVALTKDNEDVSIHFLKRSGQQYYLRGGVKDPEAFVPKGRVLIAISSTDQNSLANFYTSLDSDIND